MLNLNAYRSALACEGNCDGNCHEGSECQCQKKAFTLSPRAEQLFREWSDGRGDPLFDFVTRKATNLTGTVQARLVKVAEEIARSNSSTLAERDLAKQVLADLAVSRFEEGKPADPTENMTDEDAQKWDDMNEEHGDKFKKKATATQVARFEKGKPADPTENMSEEDAKVWHEMHDKYKDKLKTAGFGDEVEVEPLNPTAKDWGMDYLRRHKGQQLLRTPYKVGQKVQFRGQTWYVYDHDAVGSTSKLLLLSLDLKTLLRYVPLDLSDPVTPKTAASVAEIKSVLKKHHGVRIEDPKGSKALREDLKTTLGKDPKDVLAKPQFEAITLGQDPTDDTRLLNALAKVAASGWKATQVTFDMVKKQVDLYWSPRQERYDPRMMGNSSATELEPLLTRSFEFDLAAEFYHSQWNKKQAQEIEEAGAKLKHEKARNIGHNIGSAVYNPVVGSEQPSSYWGPSQYSGRLRQLWDYYELVHKEFGKTPEGQNLMIKIKKYLDTVHEIRISTEDMVEKAVNAGLKKLDLDHPSKYAGPKRTASKVAASGLYGYTKAIQADCDGACKKLTKTATKIAMDVYHKDATTLAFLDHHAKRTASVPAKILLSALKENGITAKTAASKGLYGTSRRASKLGMKACTELREAAGKIASDLHGRRQEHAPKIAGYFKTHSKEASCLYSSLLAQSFPHWEEDTVEEANEEVPPPRMETSTAKTAFIQWED